MIDLHYVANNVSNRVNNSFKILIIDYTGQYIQRILFCIETMRDEILI